MTRMSLPGADATRFATVAMRMAAINGTYAALGQLTAACLWAAVPVAIIFWTKWWWMAGLWGFATAIGALAMVRRRHADAQSMPFT
ncbi:MAG: hypothetical protein HONBIEJF_02698 [Fimbriimonadaceae bacterium]|nr:hypothetical protein [Fimbriimonadaceae bacterium]